MNDESKFPDFTNKVISFSSDESTLALFNPQFKNLADRLFVVGLIPKDGTTNDWAEGRNAAIAWDSISDFIEFESQEQYSELLAISEEKNDSE